MPASESSNRNAPVWVTGLLALAGVVLVVIAVVYFAESAGNLPSFFPGHQAGSAHHHVKHGIAALVVGLVAFVGAWLSSGTKRAV
jgi:uncharacterized membrane protein